MKIKEPRLFEKIARSIWTLRNKLHRYKRYRKYDREEAAMFAKAEAAADILANWHKYKAKTIEEQAPENDRFIAAIIANEAKKPRWKQARHEESNED